MRRTRKRAVSSEVVRWRLVLRSSGSAELVSESLVLGFQSSDLGAKLLELNRAPVLRGVVDHRLIMPHGRLVWEEEDRLASLARRGVEQSGSSSGS